MTNEMLLALKGVKIVVTPGLVRGDNPHVSWAVTLTDAQGDPDESYIPKTFEAAIERVRTIVQGETNLQQS